MLPLFGDSSLTFTHKHYHCSVVYFFNVFFSFQDLCKNSLCVILLNSGLIPFQLKPDAIVQIWMGDAWDIDRVMRKGYRTLFSSCWYLDYINYGQDWDKYYRCEQIGEYYSVLQVWAEWSGGWVLHSTSVNRHIITAVSCSSNKLKEYCSVSEKWLLQYILLK